MKRIFIIISICFLICSCQISHSKLEYYCENGTLVNDVCKIDEVKEPELVCNEEDELEDGQCKTVSMELAASIGEKTCGKGYYFYDNRCISEKTEERIPTGVCPESDDKNYVIEQGYLKCYKKKCLEKDKEGKCTKVEEPGEIFEPEISYSCPSGYKYVYYHCRKVYYPSVDFSCPYGELEDKKCIFYDYYDPDLVCEEDYKLDSDNKTCTKTYYVDASTK